MEKLFFLLLLLVSLSGYWSAIAEQLLSGESAGVEATFAGFYETVSRHALLHFHSNGSLDSVVGLWCRDGERGKVSTWKELQLQTNGLDFL